MKRLLIPLLALLILVQAGAQSQIQRPKMVIGLVVDQMRWDYLYRYFDRYGNDGFKRLIRDGFSCDNTQIPYSKTVTAAGHASIYTGSVPAVHGIVANDWIERETESFMYCTRDLSVNPVGTNSAWSRMSPANLLTSTIGDELRLATNFRGKVIGIAIKDRGSILPAGHLANAAYWFDDQTGNWVTSSYYMKDLPGWVKGFNQLRKQDELLKQDWNLLYDYSTYKNSTEDDKHYEKVVEADSSRVFPHSYKRVIGSNNYYSFRVSPYGNTYTLDFALKLLVEEKMGQRNETDLLCISLSSPDYLGHRFGPNSLEMEDCYLRLDRDLAGFFHSLDSLYGKNNYLMFLTADHGSPQISAFLAENHYPAGTLNANKVAIDLNNACAQQFGSSALVKKIYDYDLYIDMKKVDSMKLDKGVVEKFISEKLMEMNEVMTAFPVRELKSQVIPELLREKIGNNYYARRSGDVVFTLKPQYTDFTPTGLEHGTWYQYDSHIPLIWYGWGIRTGKLNRETLITDIAPTLAALLHIQSPNGSIGKVIGEALK
ncbi:MAG: alkaline phosphatase PafA [Chitinophagaceae bacterium]